MGVTTSRTAKVIKLRNWWEGYRQGNVIRDGLTVRGRLKAFLDREKVPFRVIPHPEVYTSPELAASLHTSGRRVAKVVMVRADEHYIMAVLPSHLHLDLDRFARLIGARRVALATEAELGIIFPDCELGAMPPFGGLYGLRVYLDRSLTREPEIYFQGGTHHDVIEMRYEDFFRLVRPEVDDLTVELRKASGF